MRVIYWPRIALARAQITQSLRDVAGDGLIVAEKLEDVLRALPGADGLVLSDAPADEAGKIVAALEAPGNTVKWMHIVTAGREGFEAAGLPKSLPVTYAAGAVAPTVAEHAMALLLAVGRRIPEVLAQQSECDWSRAAAVRARSLEGATMAILGYGEVGRAIAARARGFGMTLIGVSRRHVPDTLLDESHTLDALEHVLGLADVIMVTMALTEETRHLINRTTLAACKPGALLVNIARGGLIDQAALVEALESGQLGGAGLDVAEPEPLPADHPLWRAPNLILSCHFAGAGSARSLQRLAEGAASNLRRLIDGQPLEHVVRV